MVADAVILRIFMGSLVYKEKVKVSFWRLYSMVDLIKYIFSSTVKCVGKCGGEWVNFSTNVLFKLVPQIFDRVEIR